MSELSKNHYCARIRALIDQGILDPDELFKRTVQFYFANDPKDDFFWDCQDDMEEIFDAFGSLLATNFRGQPPGSSSETDDARRFRRVRNWVESVQYGGADGTLLVRASIQTNTTGKFDKRMDAVMHFFAGAQVATKAGETLSDLTSFAVEVSDEVKSQWRRFVEGTTSVGYDPVDLAWGKRGSELQNAFDVSEAKARNLARKFATGTFTLSRWKQWFKQPDKVLYSR
jgi:hypothetical protein